LGTVRGFSMTRPGGDAIASVMSSGVRSDPTGWTDARHRQGLEAERRAMSYLLAAGWQIVAHRFRAGRSEIDLVARKGRLVAFVEVKARRGDAFGSPLEAVTGPKRRDLVRVARAWMDRFGRPGDVYRFDCIGIQGHRLDHVEDAFRPGWR
jgi:putative endonuclease